MKLVREHINEKFEDESDPISDMGIGVRHLIEKWLTEKKEDYHIIMNPIIREDGKIDAYSVDISRKCFNMLPTYIKFGKILKYFACHFENKIEIQQLPEYINEELHIYTFNTPDFTKKDILDVCNVKIENISVRMHSLKSNNYEPIEIN